MLFAMVLFSGMSLEQIFQRFYVEKFQIKFGSGELYKASIFENILLFIIILTTGITIFYISERIEVKEGQIIYSKLLEKPQKIEIKNIATVLYTKSFDEIDYLYFYNKERTEKILKQLDKDAAEFSAELSNLQNAVKEKDKVLKEKEKLPKFLVKNQTGVVMGGGNGRTKVKNIKEN